MNSTNDLYVDHEVRIRILENIALNIKTEIIEMRNEMKGFRDDLHSLFRWTVGLIIGFFSTITLSIIVAIILHFLKIT